MLRFDRRLLLNFDLVLLGAVLVVALIGLANLYSSTHLYTNVGVPLYFKELTYYLMGAAIILLIISCDYRVLLTLNYPLYALMILLLLFALVFGKNISGAQRWINLGFFRLQPSEPAKLILVITLASYYYRKDTGRGFGLLDLAIPALLTGLPFILIAKQPDLGTGLLLVFVFASMTIFVKLQRTTLATILCGGLAFIPIGWKFFLKPYQRQRVETFLNPENDPLGTGYHIIQSKIAVGSGRIIGKGYLQGTQGQLDFLPERHTDFAFSVWAEEWGFLGSFTLIICYFFMILWGLNIAISARDKFGVLLAFGVVSLIFWQAFINLAMVMGLLPVVGVPLPLFSYGGSSLLTNLAGLGILMNIRMRRFMGTS
ncbi:MAG TPA: rod shape-determining protein RodA [Desulfobulbaceae bacterium]|nr:MAG: rod shape-determining protein RodA [Deltaproteobacteria bacterium RIFOXYD12_FULL_53_23]HCC54732.1 rod shape-determining protein RodA [Desulfobulbaceae bacterium]